jgi:glycosyltransferase involved in cell wall biosynthesis
MENGCDIELRYKSVDVDTEINEKFGLDPSAPLFMYIGQHVWQKNLKMVIEALKILSDKGCKYQMIFIGDGARRSDMERMVAESGLQGCVKFAGKMHDRDMIAKIYLRSSAMLFPSLYDTSSLVPREAAACGCPSVLVKGSSTAEGVTRDNGFLIENKASSLADAAEFIVKNPDKARAVGENARATIFRSWEDAVAVAFERYLYLIDLKKSIIERQAE